MDSALFTPGLSVFPAAFPAQAAPIHVLAPGKGLKKARWPPPPGSIMDPLHLAEEWEEEEWEEEEWPEEEWEEGWEEEEWEEEEW